MRQLVVWMLDAQRYALPLARVERVVRAVEITPLPFAPEIVRGILNVHGQLMPVVDMRRRFCMPVRETALADHLVIAQADRRMVAFFVDMVSGVIDIADDDVVVADAIVPGLGCIAGVVKLQDGVILIHDLDRFLSMDEEDALEKALAHAN